MSSDSHYASERAEANAPFSPRGIGTYSIMLKRRSVSHCIHLYRLTVAFFTVQTLDPTGRENTKCQIDN